MEKHERGIRANAPRRELRRAQMIAGASDRAGFPEKLFLQ
jgi:hypothetical protein